MRRLVITVCSSLLLLFGNGVAIAEDITGMFGVTGRLGFMIPADSELVTGNRIDTIDTNLDFIGGGGFIYGVNKNVAVEFDITRTGFRGEVSGQHGYDFEVINLSAGGQYRFDVTVPHLSPYLGAGLDLLINDISHAEVDSSPGLHVSAGVDYHINKRIALTTELKGVLALDADIKQGGGKIGNFDPSSLSMTFGVRLYVN